MKLPFVSLEQLKSFEEMIPTPYHLYDEVGIRENARKLYDAFSWNQGFKEYFAVKATPNPAIMKILHEEGCGMDCSTFTELLLCQRVGIKGEDIMFSSNNTPAKDFLMAAEMGAIINLDDFTHIDFLESTIGYIPKKISCRFNPGGFFSIANSIMDNPGDAKYGMTKPQIIEAARVLREKGAEEMGIHAFLASNTTTNAYYPTLAHQLFELAVEVQMTTGMPVTFINLSGGVGIPYRPEDAPADIAVIGDGVR
ncbi:MAG: diaminopimelate decarboxylase, partial [Oscillospiraceae bacterium]|nr:diaminopimelate decarboxylase [Oscillospiraceae bacterium]